MYNKQLCFFKCFITEKGLCYIKIKILIFQITINISTYYHLGNPESGLLGVIRGLLSQIGGYYTKKKIMLIIFVKSYSNIVETQLS